MAPSRENAQVHRDAAVVQPIPQKMARTIRGNKRPKAPPLLPTAETMIVGVGWADTRATSSARSGRTNNRGIKKSTPQIKLRTIVPTIALGTWTLGF